MARIVRSVRINFYDSIAGGPISFSVDHGGLKIRQGKNKIHIALSEYDAMVGGMKLAIDKAIDEGPLEEEI